MTRVLFIAERFPPDIGGLASSSSRISNALCQLGIEVDVLVWSRYLQPGEILTPGETSGEHALDRRGSERVPPREPGKIFNALFPIPQVYRIGLYRNWDMSMIHTLNLLDWLHQERSYDAVWGHYLFPAGFLAVWFAQMKGLPNVVSARGNDIDRGIFPPGDFTRLHWTLSNAKLITAVSQDLARKISILSQRDDVIVVKNAVNTEIFAPNTSEENKLALRESLGIAPDEVVLGFAGELREKKGQAFLLQALRKVRECRPACLLIIGEVRANQEAALQLYAMQYPEDFKRIIVTGHLSEPEVVARHLQLCDIFLQPSLWEGMPNALLEALACGCCCIASDAGGIPEIIEHGTHGFILPRSQLHHLGEAVLECLELDEERRHQLGKEGRNRILSEFSLLVEKDRLQNAIARLFE